MPQNASNLLYLSKFSSFGIFQDLSFQIPKSGTLSLLYALRRNQGTTLSELQDQQPIIPLSEILDPAMY